MFADRDRFLRVLGADPKKWAKRYGIEPASAPCYRCGVEQTTTVPFVCGQFRGLIAPECDCGHPTPPYCLVVDSKHGDLWDFLSTKE